MAESGKELARAIRAEIRENGPMGFEAFMQRALYDPKAGYYAAGERGIGRGGDFYTSVSVGDVFGRLLAGQMAEAWVRLGAPSRFTVVEQGAGDGRLADDVLSGAQARHADLAAAIEYVIAEPAAALRKAQERRLRGKWGARVRWVSALEGVRDIEGVCFSNECLDAFPFRRIRFEGGAWRELCVGLASGGDRAFAWQTGPAVREADLAAESALLAGTFPEGYTTEIRPAIADWAGSLRNALGRGLAMVIDYGLTEREYYDAARREGTLRCYKAHRAGDDPFEDVGGQDITAHVNFTRVAREGRARGFALAGYADQHHYLVGVGAEMLTEMEGKVDAGFARRFQTLTHPGMMGRVFKVLALARGMEVQAPPLAGFRHGEDVGLAEGA